MRAEELRIGNLVYYNGNKNEIGVVTGMQSTATKQCYIYLNNRVNNTLDLDLIKKIPLTEEWLLKFGFEYNNYPDSLTLNVLSFGSLNAYSISKDLTIGLSTQSRYMFGTTKIKHVHELQNLYFALTNNELTL